MRFKNTLNLALDRGWKITKQDERSATIEFRASISYGLMLIRAKRVMYLNDSMGFTGAEEAFRAEETKAMKKLHEQLTKKVSERGGFDD